MALLRLLPGVLCFGALWCFVRYFVVVGMVMAAWWLSLFYFSVVVYYLL